MDERKGPCTPSVKFRMHFSFFSVFVILPISKCMLTDLKMQKIKPDPNSMMGQSFWRLCVNVD